MIRTRVYLAAFGVFVWLGTSARSLAVELSLVPVRASGTHTLIGTNGIHLPEGGQRVWFEIYISNWDSDGEGEPRLKTAQAATNGGSYGSPSSPEVMQLAVQPCETDAECVATFGTGSACGGFGAVCPPGILCCAQGFVNHSHPAFVCAGQLAQCVWAGDALDLRWGFTTDPGAEIVDDGSPKYLGTLVLDEPPDLVGGLTLTFRTEESFYHVADTPYSLDVEPTDTRPARVFAGVNPVTEYPGKNRYVFFPLPEIFPSTLAVGFRIKLVSLHHPTRPTPGSPHEPADFSGLEGQYRWLGPPTLHRMVEGDPNHLFFASVLQCEPYQGDWSGVSAVYVTGSEIVPDSVYEFDEGGEGLGRIYTGRWGDVAPPFEVDAPGTQPDFGDIGALVNTFKQSYACSSRPQGQLQPQTPDPDRIVGFADISVAVNAFKGFAYQFPAPPPCP